jgi:23S rRNA (adenine2503-C2)-methyltransferase
LKLISKISAPNNASVFVAQSSTGNMLEFVESFHENLPIEKKWILSVSTLYGCPVNCKICDAGSYYLGRVSKEAIFWQLNFMIAKRYKEGIIPAEKLKVHFSRMGEPTFNMQVLDVIDEFQYYFNAPGFLPAISSIAPNGSEKFLNELIQLKNEKFKNGRFQLQFSIHTTDEIKRNELMPVKKWSFSKISSYAEKYFCPGDRKITLNFAPSDLYPVEPEKIVNIFIPELFFIKLTPVNPTNNAINYNLSNKESSSVLALLNNLESKFKDLGYQTIICLSNFEEIKIGSTCGQNIIANYSAE